MAKLNKTLEDEVLRFSQLPLGWDGEGSHAPDSATVISALMFLRALRTSLPDFILPETMCAGDGEISFYWGDVMDGYRTYAEIGFLRADEVSYMIHAGERSESPDVRVCGVGHFTPDAPYVPKEFADTLTRVGKAFLKKKEKPNG